MRVRVIKRQSIEDFAASHADSRWSLERWLTTIKYARWKVPGDIIATFGTADILGNGTRRVVFNIKGNHYRMICKYSFGAHMVHLFICWIGTHAEYDLLCKRNEQFTVHVY